METQASEWDTLLDELVRQDVITRGEYNQLNTMLPEEMYLEPNSEEEDELTKVIQATANYLVKPDKKKFMELLTEIKVEGSEDDIDATLQLEKLIDVLLFGEYLEGKPILPMIIEVKKTLVNSVIEKSKQHQMKMLLYDIKSNRYRVLIYTDDMLSIFKQMAADELLSPEQFAKLSELEDMDLPIALIIKDSKVGQGLKLGKD